MKQVLTTGTMLLLAYQYQSFGSIGSGESWPGSINLILEDSTAAGALELEKLIFDVSIHNFSVVGSP